MVVLKVRNEVKFIVKVGRQISCPISAILDDLMHHTLSEDNYRYMYLDNHWPANRLHTFIFQEWLQEGEGAF